MDFEPTSKKLEEEVLFMAPKNTLVVRLPFVWGDWLPGTGHVALGMHTDMLGSFVKSLKSLKPSTRERLLIQGRVLTPSQKHELENDDVYNFFWTGRANRIRRESQEEVIRVILPKQTTITNEDVKKYAFMRFTPETLSEKIGYKVGWYPADMLLKIVKDSGLRQNALRPMLGAVNEFRIGSNSLPGGMLRMVSGRISSGFSTDAVILGIGSQPVWENRALSMALRFIDLRESVQNLFRK